MITDWFEKKLIDCSLILHPLTVHDLQTPNGWSIHSSFINKAKQIQMLKKSTHALIRKTWSCLLTWNSLAFTAAFPPTFETKNQFELVQQSVLKVMTFKTKPSANNLQCLSESFYCWSSPGSDSQNISHCSCIKGVFLIAEQGSGWD